jgi:hypothetical protein
MGFAAVWRYNPEFSPISLVRDKRKAVPGDA